MRLNTKENSMIFTHFVEENLIRFYFIIILQEIVLMLHGYGGSNVHYCRIYEQLIRKFRIYSIDLPGMGYSSKSDILMESYEDAIEFFMGTISKFIENVIKEEKIILIGHSFGGFLAAHLFTRMPHLFSRLFLLSPAGGTYYDDSEIKYKSFNLENCKTHQNIHFYKEYFSIMHIKNGVNKLPPNNLKISGMGIISLRNISKKECLCKGESMKYGNLM